jgi:hypothetical protein
MCPPEAQICLFIGVTRKYVLVKELEAARRLAFIAEDENATVAVAFSFPSLLPV